jgi:hypothetical protein
VEPPEAELSTNISALAGRSNKSDYSAGQQNDSDLRGYESMSFLIPPIHIHSFSPPINPSGKISAGFI